MAVRQGTTRVLVLAAATALLALIPSAPASAADKREVLFKPAKTSAKTVTFRVRGVNPRRVRSASLVRKGKNRRRIGRGRARRIARRGFLRVRVRTSRGHRRMARIVGRASAGKRRLWIRRAARGSVRLKVVTDTRAPDTRITSGPTGAAESPAATFRFRADERRSTFMCRLDSSAWRSCRSPITYTGLPDGDHSFRVRARDRHGNVDASPATRDWTVGYGDRRAPRTFFGLVADEVFWERGRRAPVLAKAQSTGIGTQRMLFDWSIVERSPGVYDWTLYDEYVEDMTRAGLSILPILYHPPAFHEARPPGDTTRGTYPPRDNASLAAFATEAVQRYGPGGSFWAAHPDLGERPLRSWQIWNEPNLRLYWLPGVDPAAYVQMLRVVGGAIRRLDPGAEIVGAGLAESRSAGAPVADFVAGMYRAGGRETFDTFAMHAYAESADGVYTLIDRHRDLLDANGDADKPIWITELGWATGGPEHPYNVGEADQADLIKRVLATLVSRSADLKLKGVVYFNWRDLPVDPAAGDRWGLHTGLLRRDGSEKPAFSAFTEAIANLAAG